MKNHIGIKFWLGFTAELIIISTFWPFIFLALLSVIGIINLPIKKEYFIAMAVITLIAWLAYRIKGFKKGKYHLNEL